MTEHLDACARVLAEAFTKAVRDAGLLENESDQIEIVISTAPPLVRGPYLEGMTCPHGVTYWIEPTSEQIADWAKRGVA